MLNIFRTNQIAFNVLLIVYILLVRGSSFFINTPPEEYAGQGVLSDLVIRTIGTNGTWSIIVGMFLVFIQALLINIIVAKFRIANSVSLFPGLFYALLVSLIPEFLPLTPVLLANTFFIIAFWEILESYKKKDSSGHIYNTGFLIAIASMFYFSEITFLLLIIISFGVLRAFSLKELLMMLIGFITPYILASVYFFWYDLLGVFWGTHVIERFAFLDINITASLKSYINLGLILFIGLIVLFSFNRYYAKKNIQSQKNITVIFWSIFFAACSFLFQTNIQFYHFLLFMVPFGILLSFSFLNLKSQKAEAFHLLLFVSIIIWQCNALWLK